MELEGKTVLLTGATGGIGRAIAQRLAARGARLILSARNSARLDALAEELDIGAIPLSANLTDPADRARLTDLCRDKGLDIAVLNAGTLDFGWFEGQSPETIDAMFDLNLRAPVLLTQALLPDLRTRPKAGLVLVGSTFGSIGHPGFTGYCASKFGLRGFAESLRRELADTAVRVFYLAPRATRTDLNPPRVNALNAKLGNAMDPPSRVADELLDLLAGAHGADRHMGWPEKLFVRVNALLPGLVDRALTARLDIIRTYATDNTDPKGD